MKNRLRLGCVAAMACAVQLCSMVPMQAQAADPLDVYKQLRAPGAFKEAYSVHNLAIKRDVGTFTLSSGLVCLVEPAGGAVTAAAFSGSGSFELKTDVPMERAQLAILTKQKDQPFAENFDKLALRFSDATAEEIRKGGTKADVSACDHDILDNAANKLRTKLYYNLAARLLQDVLSKESSGAFYAFISGKNYSDKELFAVDPHGVASMGIAPEEVGLEIYDEKHEGIWYAGHLLAERGSGSDTGTQANAMVYPVSHDIDVHIDKSGFISGSSTSVLNANATSLAVVPLDLYATLRVSKVVDGNGKELKFIQENKDYDSDYWVILNAPVEINGKFTLTTSYAGKDAVKKEGAGNYLLLSGARDSWYANTHMADFANYTMKLHIPKGLTMIATGKKTGESVDGGEVVTEWKSEAPLPVAGFNFGAFKVLEAKSTSNPTDVLACANDELPDNLRPLTKYALYHTLNTVMLLDGAKAEARAAIDLYSQDYGPLAFSSVAVTQQTYNMEGQSWPGLVFLPSESLLNVQQREYLGMDNYHNFYSVVLPHEIAHQWWGNTVASFSYRDQWIEEGFADDTASLYMLAHHGLKDYLQFWKDEHSSLMDKNRFGFRANDVGPIAMGYRSSTSKAGWNIYRELVYPKGAYVLHMLRMMMWNRQNKDQAFFDTMKDFLATNQGHTVSVSELQDVFEKHMPPSLTPHNDGKMDWFFKQWVYGTAIPEYKFSHSIEKDASGNVQLSLTIMQTGVGEDFFMPVGIYLELPSGSVVKLGTVPVMGTKTVEQKINLGPIDPKNMPKRALLNYQYDVLSSNLLNNN
jgi:hypothetical protein